MAASAGTIPKIFAVLLFCLTGPCLIFLNKHILSALAFEFPMAVSALGVVSSAVFSRLIVGLGLVKLQHVETVTTEFYVKKILPVGFCFAGDLYFGNVAYIYLSVAFLQMLKAFAPVVCMCMLFSFGLEQPTTLPIVAIVIIATGTAISGYGEIHFSAIGVAYLLTSEACEGFKLVVQQKVLDNLKFPVVEGLYYMAPAASVFLILGVAILEWEKMAANDAIAIVSENPGTFFAAAMLGFGVNFSGFLVIKLLGSLSLKVISTFRNIAVVVVSARVFGDQITAIEGAGYAVATVGVVLYNYTKMYPEVTAGYFTKDLSGVVGFAVTGNHVELKPEPKTQKYDVV